MSEVDPPAQTIDRVTRLTAMRSTTISSATSPAERFGPASVGFAPRRRYTNEEQ